MAPKIMRNTPLMPKAGVIRGCIGSTSGSFSSEIPVALFAGVTEAVGWMEVVLECFGVEEGTEEVELLAGVTDATKPEDWASCLNVVVADVAVLLSAVVGSVEAFEESVVRDGKPVSVVSCRLCTPNPGWSHTPSGNAQPSTVQTMTRDTRIFSLSTGDQ